MNLDKSQEYDLFKSPDLNNDNEDINNLARHKRIQLKSKIVYLFERFNSVRAASVRQCGSYIELARYRNLKTSDLIRRLNSANFCKNRFCPMCQWRKQRKVFSDLVKRFELLNKKCSFKILFLTLTVRNVPLSDLKSEAFKLSQGWRKFSNSSLFKSAVCGYFRSIEFLGDHTLENYKGYAHPHYHALLVVKSSYFNGKNYIIHENWRNLWKRSMKLDYEPQVRISKIKPKNNNYSDIISAALEVVKYQVAPFTLQNISPDNFKLLYDQTFGLRQYALGGVLKDINVPCSYKLGPEWELLDIEIFRWYFNLQGYKHVKTDKITDTKF